MFVVPSLILEPMEATTQKTISTRNHFLVAMPSLTDSSFARSVVYICEHSSEGAIGLIINQQLDIPAKAIFDQRSRIQK